MRPCVESNCEGVPWLCNLGNMQIDGEMGEGKKERERGSTGVYNGQSASGKSRLTGESEKVGPLRGTAAEY